MLHPGVVRRQSGHIRSASVGDCRTTDANAAVEDQHIAICIRSCTSEIVRGYAGSASLPPTETGQRLVGDVWAKSPLFADRPPEVRVVGVFTSLCVSSQLDVSKLLRRPRPCQCF